MLAFDHDAIPGGGDPELALDGLGLAVDRHLANAR